MTQPRYRLVFDAHDDEQRAARDCEADVFLAWFGNSRDQLQEEYGCYDDASVFLAILDDRGEAIGSCRMIVPGGRGLKTLDDVGRDPWRVDGIRSAHAAGVDPGNTWDIATLGIRRGLRGAGIMAAAALYHGLVVASRVNGFRSIIAILDENVRCLLAGVGLMTSVLPGARTADYLGSPQSTPVYGHCRVMLDTQRRVNPDAYRLIALGIGLDGVSVPDPEAFRLHSRTSVVDLTASALARAG